MNMVQALNSAMDVMLERDPRVVILGEDVGFFGGVFRATEGLQRKYGDQRVLDTPIAEGGIIGAAIGMGANGLKPVAEIQFADYIYPGFDQIVSELARLRYRSAGDRRTLDPFDEAGSVVSKGINLMGTKTRTLVSNEVSRS